MDLRRIRYFVALAEELHFGRAVQRLGISQPPLSQQLRVLETEMGVQLLNRSNRRVELTAAGTVLLPEARALLAQAERAGAMAQRAQRGELGELRVGFTASAAFGSLIPQLILEYRRRLPQIRLQLHELTTRAQLTAMLERRLDIAFVNGVMYRTLRERSARSAMWLVARAGTPAAQEALFASLAREMATSHRRA